MCMHPQEKEPCPDIIVLLVQTSQKIIDFFFIRSIVQRELHHQYDYVMWLRNISLTVKGEFKVKLFLIIVRRHSLWDGLKRGAP